MRSQVARVVQIRSHQRRPDLCSPVRQRHKELHVADQMGNAKLNAHIKRVHVLALSAEVVATQHAVELFTQRIDEHLAATRRVDPEEFVPILQAAIYDLE